MSQVFSQPRFTGQRFENHTLPLDLEIIKNGSLAVRFEELAQLEDGWFDGQGVAPDKKQLGIVAQKMTNFYPGRLLLPTIVPRQDGNILLEWDAEGDPSVDIDLSSMRAGFHAFGPEDEDIEMDFTLDEERDFETFFEFLSAHIQSRLV